jgi:hypothetical protein
MDIELRDLIRLPNETQELAFRGCQGGIRHHIEQTDMKLTDILLKSKPFRDDEGSFTL